MSTKFLKKILPNFSISFRFCGTLSLGFIQVSASKEWSRAPVAPRNRDSGAPSAPAHPAPLRLLLRRDAGVPDPGVRPPGGNLQSDAKTALRPLYGGQERHLHQTAVHGPQVSFFLPNSALLLFFVRKLKKKICKKINIHKYSAVHGPQVSFFLPGTANFIQIYK